MNDLAAAVGLGNLVGFRERLARRREIAAAYRRALAGVPGLTLLRSDDGHESACWLFTVLVERREQFVRALKGRGIPTSVVDRRIDRYRVFGGIRAALVGQRQFDERQISLPLHSSLSEHDVQQVIAGVIGRPTGVEHSETCIRSPTTTSTMRRLKSRRLRSGHASLRRVP
jgi:perosamine synthetase